MKYKIAAGVLLVAVGFLALRARISNQPTISAIIAPHHDLVADYREQMFGQIAQRQRIDTFILLSPDHYKIEEPDILVHEESFTTRFGDVQVDPALVQLAKSHGASSGGVTFESEHGIKTILPDLARHFPDAAIVPITIKDTIQTEQLDSFIDNMQQACQACVLIASIDLSHYQPYALSEIHDRLTMRAITTLDADLASNTSEVGPPHILRSFIRWGGLSDTYQFEQHFKTNSTVIGGDLFEEGTTHVGGWYQAGEPTVAAPSVTFTYTGDIMFDRGVADHINRFGAEALLSELGDRVLWGTDLVMANLEGPFTRRPALEPLNNAPRFSFDPSAVGQLEYLHINALNTKNNHRLDAGEAGLSESEELLTGRKIQTTMNGPIVTAGQELSIVTFSVDVVAREELQAEDVAPYLDDTQYRIVVYAHWGPEEELTESTSQRRLAQDWIDLGADLVIGTGPHVIQGGEVYQNRPIIYSLGNFIFDMQQSSQTAEGLVVAGEFTQSGVELAVSIIDTSKLRPILGRSEAYDTRVTGLLRGMGDHLTHTGGGVMYYIPHN